MTVNIILVGLVLVNLYLVVNVIRLKDGFSNLAVSHVNLVNAFIQYKSQKKAPNKTIH